MCVLVLMSIYSEIIQTDDVSVGPIVNVAANFTIQG